MKRDALVAILRVRQSTLDEAQKVIADAYDAEQAASLRAQAAAEALSRELDAAMRLSGGDDAVESFARWLPVGRQSLQHAHDTQRDATTELDRARAVLSLARAGVRAVETLMEQRLQEKQKERNRREQLILDDSGRQSRR